MQTPAYTMLHAEESTPARWMMFLHGILGTRSNWRSIARQFVECRRDWGALLVDLRAHGQSLGFAPPHTIDSAARDLFALDSVAPGPIRGILGHSFGGKVALRWCELRGDLDEAWFIDVMPGQRALLAARGGVLEVLETLEELPESFQDTKAFVASLEQAGHDSRIANWLAMSLGGQSDGTRKFNLDLLAIRSLLSDYAQTDLWSVIEHPVAGAQFHVVLGGESTLFTPNDCQRLHAASESNSRLQVHVIKEAGHWVQVDAPSALLELMCRNVSL